MGTKSIVDVAKVKYGLKYVYVWHAIIGYWGGIQPGLEEYESSMKFPTVSKGVLMNEPNWKMDPIGKHEGLGLSHNIDSVYYSKQTAIVRTLDDFYPRDPVSHIHPVAECHASARAISGGNVYVNDAPGKHNFEIPPANIHHFFFLSESYLTGHHAKLVGARCQDLKYKAGDECFLNIGDNNDIGEFTSIHRSSNSSDITVWRLSVTTIFSWGPATLPMTAKSYSMMVLVYQEDMEHEQVHRGHWRLQAPRRKMEQCRKKNMFHETQTEALRVFVRGKDVHLISEAATEPDWKGGAGTIGFCNVKVLVFNGTRGSLDCYIASEFQWRKLSGGWSKGKEREFGKIR
ncbi:hypothetical protein IFM89_014007 [Coptis chinensis]|uniref:Uncharacterized protein n=1 Tax=Coptis chinensis TaxID=261450 RepID=A0A835M8V0_9MAGN|nr:hypothetical protein IFM89_014007 [Coptis chinensis]